MSCTNGWLEPTSLKRTPVVAVRSRARTRKAAIWPRVTAADGQKRPAPQPNYAEAQRTRVTIGVTPVRGSTNTFSELRLKRGTRVVAPVDRSLTGGGGRYTFDFPAFAAGSSLTLELVGNARTVSCQIDAPVLAQFR